VSRILKRQKAALKSFFPAANFCIVALFDFIFQKCSTPLLVNGGTVSYTYTGGRVS